MPLETTALVRRTWTWSAVAGVLLCAAVLLATLQVRDARADGTSDPAGVAVIGDSLTYQHGRGEAELATRLAGLGYGNIRVDGSTGRAMTTDQATAPGSLTLIRRWRRAGFDPQTYVIALGTNNKNAASSYWAGQMRKVVDAIGPGRRIIWIGLGFRRVHDARVAAFDSTAGRFAADSGMQLADWDSFVHGQDETGLWSPGGIVHMTVAGYRVRNDYVAGIVGSAP